MIDSVKSSSVVSPHSDRVSFDMHLESLIERDWRAIANPESTAFRDALRGR